MLGVKVSPAGARAAERALTAVGSDLACEHVLARILIATESCEALFVAVVHDRYAAQREQHVMGQEHAPQRFLIGNAGPQRAHEIREAPAVVIADESGQLQRSRRPTLVQSVVLEQARQHLGAGAATNTLTHRGRKGEIQHRRQPINPRVHGQQRRVHSRSVDLAENVEIRNPRGARARQHRRHELLPELRIDVLGGIDAEAVDPEALDPISVDTDEPLHHARILGHQVIEPDKVPER